MIIYELHTRESDFFRDDWGWLVKEEPLWYVEVDVSHSYREYEYQVVMISLYTFITTKYI